MSGESSSRWQVAPSRLIGRFTSVVPDRGDPTWYVLALSGALFVGFSVYMSMLYQQFVLGGADFGSYVHMFATTLAGDGWLQQGKYIASHPGGSYWGGHFTLTLLAFYPFYALVPSPYTLIVAKAFVLATSVPLLWVLARDRLDSDRLAGWVTASYALNPFLWSAWLFHFQEQVLLPVLLFSTYLAYSRGRRLAFLGLFALVLLTNEFVIIIAIGFIGGLGVAAYRDGRLRAEGPVLVGAMVLVGLIRVLASRVVGAFSAFSGIPPASIAPPFEPYIEGVRASIGELLAISLAHPDVLFEAVTLDMFEKFAFFTILLVPVLFLALTDEVTLGALVPFLGFAWVFAGRGVYYTFGAHYPLYLLPFIYIGTVRVLGRLEGWKGVSEFTEAGSASLSSLHPGTLQAAVRSGAGRAFLVVLVLCVIGSATVVAGQSDEDVVQTDDEHDELRKAAFDSIPESASLLTQNDLYPHVATRPNATFIPVESTFGYYERTYGTPRPEYVLFDTKTWWATPVANTYAGQVGSGYGLRAYEDGIWILERGYNGPPQGITGEYTLETRQYDASSFVMNDAQVVAGSVVASGGQAGTYLWYGPNALFPPGTYEATFAVNTTGVGSEPIAGVDVAGGPTHQVFANETIPARDGEQNVTVRFTFDQPVTDVEFRGYRAGGNGTIALDSVTVRPASNTTATDGPADRTGSRDERVNTGEMP
jgi:uncharacterized membrane protein